MKQPGFSLMEMMIVLLIMSIIAAATAPIVSKKMSKSASSSNANPWVFIDTKGNAAFNMAGKDVTAVIGASKVPTGVSTRLYIDCGSSNSQLTFGKGDEVMQVTADPSGRAGISSDSIQPNSVAIGGNQSLSGSSTVTIGQNASTTDTGATAIGASAKATGNSSFAAGASANASGRNSISIGSDSKASGTWSVAIGGTDTVTGAGGKVTQATGSHAVALGTGASASGSSGISIGDNASSSEGQSIAIGNQAKASNQGNIALGYNAQATSGTHSLALGYNAVASHRGSTAIGSGAQTSHTDQIVLGMSGDTVYIPGNLIVEGNTILGWGHGSRGSSVYLRESTGNGDIIRLSNAPHSKDLAMLAWEAGTGRVGYLSFSYQKSDKRLKNISKKYTDGLDALKKLDFYHYTFKKDEAKTPHVGVIAQDLQKVFPNAVTKADDGYLTIRMEDMFYAVINAVKELDIRYKKQEKRIDELEKQNAELLKRIEKLESK